MSSTDASSAAPGSYQYISAREAGSTSEEASGAARRYMEELTRAPTPVVPGRVKRA
jgi:hypothetical protein